MADVCYRLPGQEEDVPIFRQEEEASRSKALVLMGDLICADGNTALNKQSWGYMKGIDENFLAVVTGDPALHWTGC